MKRWAIGTVVSCWIISFNCCYSHNSIQYEASWPLTLPDDDASSPYITTLITPRWRPCVCPVISLSLWKFRSGVVFRSCQSCVSHCSGIWTVLSPYQPSAWMYCFPAFTRYISRFSRRFYLLFIHLQIHGQESSYLRHNFHVFPISYLSLRKWISTWNSCQRRYISVVLLSLQRLF